jgi:hypothetical protein
MRAKAIDSFLKIEFNEQFARNNKVLNEIL